jgi:hypothetical protein
MERKVGMTPITGILAILGAAAVLLPIGCESPNRVVASDISDTCPICERETRIHPITGLDYTTCICPTCGTISTLDPRVQDAVERFTGPNIGDRVHVCDSCGNIIEDCATCRENRRLQAGAS